MSGTNFSGSSSLTGFVEATAAGFGVHTGATTPPFIVTMNSNHNVAGVFDGNNAAGCDVTIQGNGIMTFPSGAQGVNCASGGFLRINTVIAGTTIPTMEGLG